MPLLPCRVFQVIISRLDIILDDRASPDRGYPLSEVRYYVWLQNMSTVSRGRLTKISFPSRDVWIRVGEGIKVLEGEIGAGLSNRGINLGRWRT